MPQRRDLKWEIFTKVAGTSEAAASAGFDAGNKRIASESFGASAYGDVVTHVTLGVDAAGGRARTDATVVLAHLVRWAINIFWNISNLFIESIHYSFSIFSADAN